jgi:hypothetical protein
MYGFVEFAGTQQSFSGIRTDSKIALCVCEMYVEGGRPKEKVTDNKAV